MHVGIRGDYLSKFAFSLTFIRLGNNGIMNEETAVYWLHIRLSVKM
jgi:hypothetical protein